MPIRLAQRVESRLNKLFRTVDSVIFWKRGEIEKKREMKPLVSWWSAMLMEQPAEDRFIKGEILSEHFEMLFCHSQKAFSVF